MAKHSSSTRIPRVDSSLVELARMLRKDATPADRKLWFSFLRDFKPPFYWQRPIDRFIVNYFCPTRRLVIELDEDVYAVGEAEARYQTRTRALERFGLKVVLFTNRDILDSFDDVVSEITRLCGNDSE